MRTFLRMVTVPNPCLMTLDYLERRAKRASRQKFEAALAKLPDVEPETFDQF